MVEIYTLIVWCFNIYRTFFDHGWFMRFLNVSLPLVATLFYSSFSSTAQAFSLETSYQSALQNYRTEAISDARIEQSLEAKSRGQGTYLPKISAVGSYSKVDTQRDQTTGALNLTSNLFNGGRDRNVVKNAELGVQIAQNLKQVEKINLYMSVVDAYYNYLLNVNDLKNIDLLKNQTEQRASEIRRRLDIGKSRRGELLQAEAQLASVEATRLNGVGVLNQSEVRFLILTGLEKKEKVASDIEAIGAVKSLKEYIELGLKREDVVNRELELQRVEGELKISKAHFMPSLDFNSNYYAYRKTNSAKDADWDVGLTLRIPLYEGGISQAKQREDFARKNVATIDLENFKRNLIIEVTNRYETYKRYVDQINAYERALTSSKQSYDETIRDYRLGLVTNLDVLTSLNLYLTNKREAEKTRYLALLNYKLLEASAGIIPSV